MIKGVNLGNWLVLEKWMSPNMFLGTEAEDETFLCKGLEDAEKARRYQEHRSSYITERDFQYIAASGMTHIRIPVPYFLFDDFGPFLHCYEYLDKAFDWAEKYGLKLLVDLHTVPGGQNGTDNSGLCGVCTWSTKLEYLETTLEVLEKIAARYGAREALWGIEVLNEPMCSDTPIASMMNISILSFYYHAADPNMAKDNTNYSLAFLQDFYRTAYRRLRKHLPKDVKIVFSDAFYLEGWAEFFADPEMDNIVLDTHQYLQTVEFGFGEDHSFKRYEQYLGELEAEMNNVTNAVPTIAGEWCLSNHITGYEHADEEEKKAMLQQLCRIYRKAIETGEGWFYWSYKLDSDEDDKLLWDFRKCIDNGWLVLD